VTKYPGCLRSIEPRFAAQSRKFPARMEESLRKHGLNVPAIHDPDVGADVAFMAEEIDQPRYNNTINEPMGPAFVKTN
jgi:hypothetical protein